MTGHADAEPPRKTPPRLPDDNPPLMVIGGAGRVVQVSVAIIAMLALLYALREARLFLMPTMLGALIALAATPLCAAIERTGLPSSVSAMLVTASLVLGLGTFGWAMLPSLDEWRYRAPEVAVSLERKLRRLQSTVEEVTKTAAKVAPDLSGRGAEGAAGNEAAAPAGAAAGASAGNAGDGEKEAQGPAEQIVEGGRQMLVDVLGSAPEVIGAVVYGIFLVYFLMAERRRVRRWAMMLSSSRRQAARVARAVVEIRTTVGLYLATVSIINISLGLATAVAFWLIGMPAPLLWGAFMTMMNFMPYIGPLIVQACALAVGIVIFDTMTEAFYPLAALIVLNTLEGQLITPMVLGRRLSASPLAVFLAVAFGAWMWGAIGAIVATPALIAGSGFVNLWVRESRQPDRQTWLARGRKRAAARATGGRLRARLRAP